MRRETQNPPNRFQEQRLQWHEAPPQVELRVREITAKSILSRNESPDLGFDYGANPYQGCYHGCTYCYARTSHQYLQLGAGTDFERVLMVKTNAAALLEHAFERPSWRGELVVVSGNTDCYQPLEAEYGLTRALLEVCLRYRNPVGVITKGRTVHRDVALLAELARQAWTRVWISIAVIDEGMRKQIEPFAAPLDQRFQAIAALSEAGVPTGVAVAPVIPGLNDSAMAPILRRAREAGASAAFMCPVRLAPEVADVFFSRLAESFPGRAAKVRRQVLDMRNGNLHDGRYGRRMEGVGVRWRLIERVFQTECQRLGLRMREWPRPEVSPFRRPRAQLPLFE